MQVSDNLDVARTNWLVGRDVLCTKDLLTSSDSVELKRRDVLAGKMKD